MKRPVQKALVLAVGVVVLIAGCGAPEPPSVKKSRLIAAENRQLREELEQRSKEIEKLKERHDREMKEQEEVLAKCLEEKETWKKKSQESIRDQVKGVLDVVVEENAKLREENEGLKAQIEELKAERGQVEEAKEDPGKGTEK